jgi:hypothetical protein
MIESYSFGSIVINGKHYTSDVIIFPDRVIASWWRKEGHRLSVEDLETVLKSPSKPEVLIVGTGYSGLMKVTLEVQRCLKKEGIKLVVQPTREASETFNQLVKQGKHVVAAMHLTC